MMYSPRSVPLPDSPLPPRPPSPPTRRSSASTQSSFVLPPPAVSPRTVVRPRLSRNQTSATVRPEPPDPFKEGTTISVNQPVGSLSISPSSRDVCLASRKGLYILDLANLNNAPRFIPQGGTWQIADCQWSPHSVTSNLILSTSSQKLLVWDLSSQTSRVLLRSIDAHSRAITDINWHARDPNLMATVAMDAGIRAWDMRMNDNRPLIRLCAWGQAGTQVKWNRQHDHILATAHGKEVIIWDDRKGSVPVCTIKAHDAKIYGIDWDRRYRHKLVTCSLDKTIKFWSVPDLAEQATSLTESHVDFYPSLPAPDQPTRTISTTYPVWRARHLPFGEGVLALPQRGEKALEMYGMTSEQPVERFEGHDDVVKEFVWRHRGGDDRNFDDREFQLVTWSKDRTLRVWPVSREMTERVGFKYGDPINVLHTRCGAPNITYTRDPDPDEKSLLPPPMVTPSGIARQKIKHEVGMTRGGGKSKAVDQLDWLSKVVNNKASPDSSVLHSRMGSVGRSESRAPSSEGRGGAGEWISLKDEVVMVNKLFPRPRINFEKIDLHHRKLTMSMNGPWANGDRMAFMRIHWSFPAAYPYSPEVPTFELERNPTVSPITRQHIIQNIKLMRATNRQCLVATSAFLLGVHERGRRLIDESDSEDEAERQMTNVPMLIRTCGATFGPSGQLVCFFPKQTVLPRARTVSRSPSESRNAQSPLVKAMFALSRMENSRKRGIRLKHPRIRRLENVPVTVQAGSTVTIHDVSQLGYPDPHLAATYSMSIDDNLHQALEAKRLDHAEVWATFKGLLNDPPPPYSEHPPLHRETDARRERERWEQGIARKRIVLDQIYSTVIAARDVQLLAVMSCILLQHIRESATAIPPQPEAFTNHSPQQDYFTLPRVSSFVSPFRKRPSLTPVDGSSAPASAGASSFRASGWSQILNPSSISLRTSSSGMTPKRPSFDAQSSFATSRIPALGSSFEDRSPTGIGLGMGIPVPFKRDKGSPRVKDAAAERERDRERARSKTSFPLSPTQIQTPGAAGRSSGTSGTSGTDRSSGPTSAFHHGAVLTMERQRSMPDKDRSHGSSTDLRSASTAQRSQTDRSSGYGYGNSTGPGLENRHKVSFGGGGSGNGTSSPLRRNMSRATMGSMAVSTPGTGIGGGSEAGGRNVRVCSVKMEMLQDETPPPTLLSTEMLARCEGFKLAYADYLLRQGLLGQRTALMQFEFLDSRSNGGQPGDLGRGKRRDRSREGLVCVGCAAGAERCPSCEQVPIRPTCALCRLPIKGLSMSCGICTHRTHSTCFRSHFTSSVPSATCPSCPCRCLAEQGTSYPSIVIPLPSISPPASASMFARGSIRSGITPINTSVTPGTRSEARLTYATLQKTLSAIQEHDQRLQAQAQAEAHSHGHAQMYPGQSRGGALGFSPDGEGEEEEVTTPLAAPPPSRAQPPRLPPIHTGTGLSTWSHVVQGVSGVRHRETESPASLTSIEAQAQGQGQSTGQGEGQAQAQGGVQKGQSFVRDGLLSRGRLRGLTGDAGILTWKGWES